MQLRMLPSLVLVAVGLSPLLGAGCSSSVYGVEACRRIEEVRCQRAASCQIDLSSPAHDPVNPEADVANCARHYRDACVRGMAITREPGGGEIDRCVETLKVAGCVSIRSPESEPACAFLNPSADASADAVATVDGAPAINPFSNLDASRD
jgi:hypothetical protein